MRSWSCVQRHLPAGRHDELPFDQVLAGDHLGHGMLDLQAGVHLHEVEGAVLVGDELDGAGADDSRSPWPRRPPPRPSPCAAPGPCRAPAPPRSPSGGGAGSSSRARTGRGSCRGCRRRPGSRCGAAASGTSRPARDRRRTRPWPRAWRRPARRRTSPALSTTRMPLPPPPADALISTGKPMRVGLLRQQRRATGRRRDSPAPAAPRPSP